MLETLLSAEEALELDLLEGGIQSAFWDICAALQGIENQRLYRAQYAIFSDYLLGRWPGLVTPNTWRQWRASYDSYLIATGEGATLINEYAARALRTVEREARALVIRKSAQYAGTINLKAADITPVAKIVAEVLREAGNTGGYVDTGDGSMTALEAAVDLALQERLERKRQHIADSVKGNGWSIPTRFYWGGYDNLELPGEWDNYPMGTQIEVRWRIVEQENET